MTRFRAGRSLRAEASSAHQRGGKQCRLLPWSPAWYARPSFDRTTLVGRNDGGKRHVALGGAAETPRRFATDLKVSPEN